MSNHAPVDDRDPKIVDGTQVVVGTRQAGASRQRSTRLMRIRLNLGALAFLAALPGTATSQRGAVTFAAKDSAGVRLAMNGGATDSASTRIIEELRIGVVSGDAMYQFDRIGPIAVDAKGTIFVSDGGGLTIRVFTPQGEFVRQFGRRGQGPGEFTAVHRLWFAGDSLMVTDRSARRATMFAKTGTTVESWDLRLPEGARAELLAKTPSGWLSWVRRASRELSLATWTLYRDTSELRMLLDPSVKTLGPVLRRQAGTRGIAGAEVYPVGPLFEPVSLTAIGVDGSQYFAADGQYSIDVFSPSGRLRQRVVRSVPTRPITPNDVQSLRDALAQRRIGPATEMGSAVERSAKNPTAPAFATIGALLVAPDGTLLVERIDDVNPIELEFAAGFGANDRGTTVADRQAARWERFDATGRYLGAVRLPRRFYPRDFDGSTVIGVQKDADGVEFVVRYRITGA
jgi:hypothetical protein